MRVCWKVAQKSTTVWPLANIKFDVEMVDSLHVGTVVDEQSDDMM